MSRKQQMDTSKRSKFNETFQHVIDSSAPIIAKELSLTTEVAVIAAGIVIGRLQEIAGGEGFYIGKGHLWYVSEKHRRIYRRFTGANHAALAHEFGVTVRHVYDVVKNLGAEEFERKQIKLFE